MGCDDGYGNVACTCAVAVAVAGCDPVEWCRNTDGGAPRAEVAGSLGGGTPGLLVLLDRDGVHWSGEVVEACESDDRYAPPSGCVIMMFSDRNPTCIVGKC